MKQNLANLKTGQKGVIIEVNVEDEKRKIHLLEMGLTKGTKIKVKKIAPTGGTISIGLRGYELCISQEDAKKIFIQII